MSKYNPVYNNIWTSNRFNQLSFETKFVFLYLLTNERVTQTGIYTIAPKHIACDTDIQLETVIDCIDELESYNLIKFWHEDNLIFIIDNFKFARNTIKNAKILDKVIQGQRNLYYNEELWELFDIKYQVELDQINNSLINYQSNKNNNINKSVNNSIYNNHNNKDKRGI